jgi:hypothetical protein
LPEVRAGQRAVGAAAAGVRGGSVEGDGLGLVGRGVGLGLGLGEGEGDGDGVVGSGEGVPDCDGAGVGLGEGVSDGGGAGSVGPGPGSSSAGHVPCRFTVTRSISSLPAGMRSTTCFCCQVSDSRTPAGVRK